MDNLGFIEMCKITSHENQDYPWRLAFYAILFHECAGGGVFPGCQVEVLADLL